MLGFGDGRALGLGGLLGFCLLVETGPCNLGALIIRIGFLGESDIRLRRTKLQMTCASSEWKAAYELRIGFLGI